MADTEVSKTFVARRVGSNPTPGTKHEPKHLYTLAYCGHQVVALASL